MVMIIKVVTKMVMTKKDSWDAGFIRAEQNMTILDMISRVGILTDSIETVSTDREFIKTGWY